MPDTRLLGQRYEVGEELGYGGMAEVFRARDTRLGRDVAVKVLRRDLARDPNFLGRFRREAQSAAGLNHPNIVSVYDTGEQDGIPYIVMEYVAGRTLRDAVAEDGRLLPRRALEIVGDICGALEYSHRAGIVHRDIKPGNVMLTRTGEVKVMDFGIARAASQTAATMTETSQVLGTAQYLSPEQARGEHVDNRSDIYSTGCLLYELLTGVPPFQGDSALAVAYQHVRENPIPPSQIEPELPASLDAVVLKAMAKNPSNRYQTAADFKLDVDRAAAGRRVEATPVLAPETSAAIPPASPTTVLLRPEAPANVGRRRAAYAALALAVLAVFAAVAFIILALTGGGTSTLKMPTLTGLTQAQAEQLISQDGLSQATITMTPIGQGGNTKPAGTVIGQSPLANFNIKKDTPITLDVSAAIARVQVPDVTGQSLADAGAALKAVGLSIGTEKESNVSGVAGTVLMVDPPPGSTVNKGSAVTVTVVSGTQQVPFVKGEPIAQALDSLGQAGFMVKQIPAYDLATPGTVIAQSPSGGTQQANNATITLTVSKGPAPVPSSSAPPSSASSPPPTSGSATTSPSTSASP